MLRSPFLRTCRLLLVCTFFISSTQLKIYGQAGVMVGRGRNDFGQLGGTVGTSILVPRHFASGIEDVVSTTLGSLLLHEDGQVYGMGWNVGQFLNPSPSTPTYLRNLTLIRQGAAAIAGAQNLTLIVDHAGNLYGRGSNNGGRLGQSDTHYSSTIVHDWTLLATNVSNASVAGSHTLWITQNGELWGLGTNSSSQLGVPHVTTITTTPVLIATDVSSAIAGSSGTIFIKTDGSLWAMGRNHASRFGPNQPTELTTPQKIADHVISADFGSENVYYVTADGVLWESGGGTSVVVFSHLNPHAIATNVRQVSAATQCLLYIDNNDNVWATGANPWGQLGLGDQVSRTQPTWVTDSGSTIAAGHQHSLILKQDGNVWGMGDNTNGQLAHLQPAGQENGVRTFTRVHTVAAGGKETVFIRAGGDLWTAGLDTYGSRGLGVFNDPTLREATLLDTGVSQANTSGRHTLWTKHNGSLWATGYNVNDQLGITTGFASTSPVQVGSETFQQTRAAGDSSYFLHVNGSLWVAGRNHHGQLGTGNFDAHTITQVATNTMAVDLSPKHAAWVDANGVLHGAGAAENGALGTGKYGNVSSPTTIHQGVTKVACSLENTYFVTTDSTLWGLGGNQHGQLGSAPSATRNDTPVSLANNVTKVAASGYNVAWIDKSGDLWGLGINEFSQLGSTGQTQHSTAVKIAAQVQDVAIGDQHVVYSQVPETFLSNLSTRVTLTAHGSDLVAGFVISGTEPMEVLVRAVGPSLVDYGVGEPLANPSFRIFDGSAQVVDSNDDWGSNDPDNLRSIAQELGAFALREGSADAATVVTLNPGAYTVRVERPAGTAGTVLLELYKRDVDQWRSRLMNLSVRNFTGSGDDTMIAGFATAGSVDTALLVRAVGPTLADYGVTGTLDNPQLRVSSGLSTLAQNDNWGGDESLSTTANDVGAFALPETSKDAATIIRLAPGAYTAQVSGSSESDTGQALIEVYAVDE